MPGDTSCSRFERITASDDQRAAFKGDRKLWEPLVNQLVAHNRMFEQTCEKP